MPLQRGLWAQPTRKSLSAELRRDHRVSPNKSFSANLGVFGVSRREIFGFLGIDFTF
jgi:hypothetical protein